MTDVEKFFHAMHRFRRLRIPERIGMLPRAEHILLESIRSGLDEDGTPLNAACMARQMHISAPAVSRTMRRLRERGYITADPNPEDRRLLRAQITPEGRERMEEDRRKMDALVSGALAQLEPGEAEQFFQTFERLCAVIEDALESK
ncbi:MAG: MarR family winged helix-turn-helix transcriptional regulator [Butyricicoccus sp.]